MQILLEHVDCIVGKRAIVLYHREISQMCSVNEHSKQKGQINMGIFDFLKASEYKKTIQEQQKSLDDQQASLDDKQASLDDLQASLDDLRESLNETSQMTVIELEEHISRKREETSQANSALEQLQNEINIKQQELVSIQEKLISFTEQMEMEEFGLYRPRYNFATALIYKDKLKEIRDLQKIQIKDKTAVSFFENWTVDGSIAKGRKMTNDNIKQILRSFNSECEAAISKVKFSNYDSIKKRIERSYEQLNKLNITNRISIRNSYLQLKIDELDLAYEYEQKKEQEKEELREQREQEREERKLQAEIRRAKLKIDKDIDHFQQMIDDLTSKISETEEGEKHKIQEQILKLLEAIQAKEDEKEEMDYRLAHSRAGYAYIISNIGSFGQDVVKIGVTRRLNPYERIGELSSASVPFRYDIHALIFSYDAYGLESELHKKFEHRRVNAVNSRKEFFRISIPELKDALDAYKDLTIDFTEIAEAEEYRKTIKMRGTE